MRFRQISPTGMGGLPSGPVSDLVDGYRALTLPLGRLGWRVAPAVVYVAAVVVDLVSTVALVTSGWGFREGNPLASVGQAHLGLLGYCVAASVLLLVTVTPVLLFRPRRASGWAVQITAAVIGAAKVAVVASNLVLWIGMVR